MRVRMRVRQEPLCLDAAGLTVVVVLVLLGIHQRLQRLVAGTQRHPLRAPVRGKCE